MTFQVDNSRPAAATDDNKDWVADTVESGDLSRWEHLTRAFDHATCFDDNALSPSIDETTVMTSSTTHKESHDSKHVDSDATLDQRQTSPSPFVPPYFADFGNSEVADVCSVPRFLPPCSEFTIPMMDPMSNPYGSLALSSDEWNAPSLWPGTLHATNDASHNQYPVTSTHCDSDMPSDAHAIDKLESQRISSSIWPKLDVDFSFKGLVRSHLKRKQQLQDIWGGSVEVLKPECGPYRYQDSILPEATATKDSKEKAKKRPHKHRKPNVSKAAKAAPPDHGAVASATTQIKPVKMCLPLTGYNYFYRNERANIVRVLQSPDDPLPPPDWDFGQEKHDEMLHEHWYIDPYKEKRDHKSTHGCIGFRTLSKVIAARWKQLPPAGRAFYRQIAKADQEQYDLYKPPHDRLNRVNSD